MISSLVILTIGTVLTCSTDAFSLLNFVKLQVLTAASMKFRIVFLDVLPCRIIVDRRLRGTCCLHHQGWVPDDGGSTYLWNIGRKLFYTAVHPRRQFWTVELSSIRPIWIPVSEEILICLTLWTSCTDPSLHYNRKYKYINFVNACYEMKTFRTQFAYQYASTKFSYDTGYWLPLRGGNVQFYGKLFIS
jgi:hypothetical protein